MRYRFLTRLAFQVLLLGALLPTTAFAILPSPLVSEWQWQHPWPQGNLLFGADFVTSDLGWTVGGVGTISRTSDGGRSWLTQASGTTRFLTDVDFVDASLGVVVGDSGTILRTTDGGATWALRASETTSPLMDIEFTDASNGWAVGAKGTILHTADGGLSWSSRSSSSTADLMGVSFTDSLHGHAVGLRGSILSTTDGGTTWVRQSSGTTEYLYDIDFTDEFTGRVVGDAGVVCTTSDGGTTWTVRRATESRDALMAVTFLDATTGIAVGENGTVLRTDDGGASWLPRSSGAVATLTNVGSPDGVNVWMVGYSGTIAVSSDSGSAWTFMSRGPVNQLNAVHFTDSATGIAVGDGGVALWTTSGGTAWTQLPTLGVSLHGAFLADKSTGWVVGDHGVVLRTDSGGSSWTTQTPIADCPLYDVEFVGGSSVGWIVGGKYATSYTAADNVILRTDDGGVTWRRQNSTNIGRTLTSTDFVDTTTGWAVGTEGFIIKTINGGDRWIEQNSGTGESFAAVSFADAASGWAVGWNGVIHHTQDGGANWQRQSSGTIDDLRAVYAVNSLKCYAAGEQGRLLVTENGGLTWESVSIKTMSNLKSLYFADSESGWVAGADGAILHLHTTPAPTSLSPGPTTLRIRAGSAATIQGVLSDDHGVLVGKVIELEQSVDGAVFKPTAHRATTDAQGRFAFQLSPTEKTSYRPRFRSETGYQGALGSSTLVRVSALVSAPRAPRETGRSRRFVATGYLRPQHAAGSHSVRVYLWRAAPTGWISYGYRDARVSDGGSSYSCPIRLPGAGRWRLRAVAPADDQHDIGVSALTYVTAR